MMRISFAVLTGTAFLLAGCATTPETKHELACAAGTLTGAVIGGLAGSALGKGSGNRLMTAAGAGAGAGVGTLACQ